MYQLNLTVLELFLLLALELPLLVLALIVAFRPFRANLGSFTNQSISHVSPSPNRFEQGKRRFEFETSQSQLPLNVHAYTPDILIRVPTGEYTIAAAALDTQCQLGNWISERLVEELGMVDSIRKDTHVAQVFTANGEEVESTGTIDLVWKLALNESRVFRSRFYILGGARHLDVILGQDIISKEGFLSLNMRKLLAPFTSHRPLTKEEKAAIKAEEARQKEEKKALEARRQAAQQAQAYNQRQ